jgi:IclR family transcriptional regulator, acetate operon repressor
MAIRDSTAAAPSAAKPRIQSVARAAALLNEIAHSPAGLTAQELSTATGLSRATTYHLVQTLTAVGYIAAGADRRYRLSIGVGAVVEGFERHVVPEDFLPLARALAQRTGETAYVAAREGPRLVLLCSVPGHHHVSVAHSPIGPIEHGHARASGKLLLALAPEDARERYLAANPLARLTSRTITSRGELLAELERIREAGYSTDLEEFHEGVCCFAAPLARGAAPYALALSAPKERFRAHRDEYLDAVLRTAAESVALSERS